MEELSCRIYVDNFDKPIHTLLMSCGKSSCKASVPQCMVDRTPAYEKRKGRRKNQVIGKGKIIRADKRMKARYL